MIAREHEFWQRVQKTDTCWLWTGALNSYGYGTLSRWTDGKRRQLRAHRVAYELLVGPIPEGLVLDHLCRVKVCVNPAHLEAVTDRVNIYRAIVMPTHCPHGHRYTDRRNGRGERVCVECIRIKNAAYTAKERERLGRQRHNRHRTHCLRGHPLDGPDVRIDRNGRRQCRACERARYHEKQASQ